MAHVSTTATTVTASNAWVTLRRATLTLPRARWIDATTEQPDPTISPMPVSSISTGITMLMAAIPSLPTQCPTKIPSIAVTADIPSIPNSVGKNNRLKSTPTSPVPKSIASSLIIVPPFLFILYIGMKKRTS